MIDGVANGRQLGLRLRLVEKAQPVPWFGEWPSVKSYRTRRVPARPGAAPSPMFSAGAEISPQSVPLRVAADRQEVFVLLYRKRLESPLINWAGSRGAAAGVPALTVRHGEPAHVFRKCIVLLRPEQQMPMVRHDALGQHAHFHMPPRLLEQADKGIVVAV